MSVPSQSEDAEEEEAGGSKDHEEEMFDLSDVDPMESLNLHARPWLRHHKTRGEQENKEYSEEKDNEDGERGDRIDDLPGMRIILYLSSSMCGLIPGAFMVC